LYQLAGIEKKSVEEFVSFLDVFKTASLEMEATKKPTLYLPLPWYYKMKQYDVLIVF